MKSVAVITALGITLASSIHCFADTLVITYRSGKTQTVVLDEPSTTINSWQFVGGSAAAPTLPQQPVVQQPTPQEAPKATDKKAVEKPADKKSNVRFQWNAPPIRE